MTGTLPELILVGGGHTHVQVLKRFAMEPPPARLTLVVDVPVAVYSGMVPGFVAGQYQKHELEIDVVPLARLAGARVVLSKATGLDPVARRLLLEGRPSLRYDWISFDIGSTVAGSDLPGVREHALPTRPIADLVRRIHELVERAKAAHPAGPFKVAVVGSGAGGVELAFTIESRLRRDTGRAPLVTLLSSAKRPVEEYTARLSRRVEQRATDRGIEIRTGVEVVSIDAQALRLRLERAAAAAQDRTARQERFPTDAVLWVAGAASHPTFRSSGLPLDDRGFLLIRPTLQSLGDDRVFAAGDCATLAHSPTPKAGVYAVRQGPYLTENLRAVLDPSGARSLRSYRPQRDFLTLLNLGDGTALGHKWGRVIEGAWVMRLKDRIDRAFMRRFQALEPDGTPTPELAPMYQAMSAKGSEMLCGGCAAKVPATALGEALDRLGEPPIDPAVVLGLAEREDAAAYRGPAGDQVFTTLDAFRAFTDDPWLVGRVATLNAASDLHAKGIRPRFAQALVAVPSDLSAEMAGEVLFQALAGARHELDRLGVALIGGHSTTGPELQFGLVVGGFLENSEPLRKNALQPGDDLVLTKPLGTGVLLHADMLGRARGPWIEQTFRHLLQDNAAASAIARDHGGRAATDITGFGLAGHASELARASNVRIVLYVSRIPALFGALELLAQGLRSTSHAQNETSCGTLATPAGSDATAAALLHDPQTAGGLLLGVAPENTETVLAALHAAGYASATTIGRVARRADPPQRPGLELVP
ncbi:MAG TPA: selenide, water dikinase SelD [Thermoanaerobaculia bacterium]|nr:selenide, water dikinase SelD [Thermoanaerobaculia bacterium]